MKNLQFLTLASGSSGNATVVFSNSTVILVDAGISRKALRSGLLSLGLGLEEISAFVITHAHYDHTHFLQNAHNNTSKVPILGSKPTLKRLGKWADKFKKEIKIGGSEMVGEIRVTPIPLPHDEPGCFGYMFNCNGRSFALATDFGSATEDVKHFIRCAHAILIETNYDSTLLENGSYSDQLKDRIAGSKGHLSNNVAAEILSQGASDKLHLICCAHLSKENNTPERAIGEIRSAFQREEKPQVEVIVAPRNEPGLVITV